MITIFPPTTFTVRRTEIEDMDRVGVVAEIERYQFLREDENTGSKASNFKRERQSDLAQRE